MAKKAAKAPSAKADAADTASDSKKISKIEAVRLAMKKYPKAKPRELAPLILADHGIKLSPQRISMAGVYLRKKSGKPGRRGKAGGVKTSARVNDMTISEYVAVQKVINDLGGEAKVQKLLDQYTAAKKIFASV
jgi:hypothetical protein